MDKFDVKMEGNVVVIELKGDLVKREFPGLAPRMGLLVRQGARGFVFDLSKVDFIDSSGVGLMLEAKNVAEQNGQLPMVVCEVPPGIYSVLDRLGVEKVFRFIRERKRAIEKVAE